MKLELVWNLINPEESIIKLPLQAPLIFLGLFLLPLIGMGEDVFLEQTTMALKAKQIFFFSAKIDADQPLVRDTSPTGNLSANFEYNFYRTYSTGLEFAYKQPFSAETENYNGVNDLILYFSDRDLWSNHHERMGLSYKVSAVFPTSYRAQQQSLYWGLSEQLMFRKGFGIFSLIYAVDVAENFYQYDTSAPSAYALSQNSNSISKFNSPASVANRIIASLRLLRDFRWQNAAQIRSSTDFNGSTSSTYSLSSGFAYEVTKNAVLNFGIRSSVRDTGTQGPGTSETSVMGDYLFDPYGTMVFVGTTLRI